jgi:hypothetical protein
MVYRYTTIHVTLINVNNVYIIYIVLYDVKCHCVIKPHIGGVMVSVLAIALNNG